MEAKLVLEERNELLGVIGALSSRLGTSELFVVDDETVATRKADNGYLPSSFPKGSLDSVGSTLTLRMGGTDRSSPSKHNK